MTATVLQHISSEEAAKRLGVSRRRVLAMIEDGTLASVKISRVHVIPVDDLDRLIAERTMAPPPGFELTPIEAASILSVSPGMVRVLVREQKLESTSRRGRIFISKKSVQREKRRRQRV